MLNHLMYTIGVVRKGNDKMLTPQEHEVLKLEDQLEVLEEMIADVDISDSLVEQEVLQTAKWLMIAQVARLKE